MSPVTNLPEGDGRGALDTRGRSGHTQHSAHRPAPQQVQRELGKALSVGSSDFLSHLSAASQEVYCFFFSAAIFFHILTQSRNDKGACL